ncbi:hypothetical protein MalM25_05480 [Planctomycetes bacterium MalM25]|nr:hypothetical protein MalM25_05480 [Planctomycetes bacterium MalM25]
MPGQDHGNLVLSFVGDDSVHPSWIEGPAERDFDLGLVYYGDTPGRYEEQADFYLAHKGFKFWLLKELAESHFNELFERYERVWLPDDDIRASTAQVNRLFELFEKHHLSVAQPAIDQGALSYAALRVDRRFEIRYSKYVEVMCPLFTRQALLECLPTFHETKSSWGLDWLWSHRYDEEEIAIIDAVAVDHTRPLATGSLYKQLTGDGVTPNDEFRDLRYRHGIHNRRYRRALVKGTARMRGVLLDGAEGWNRPRFGGWLGKAA